MLRKSAQYDLSLFKKEREDAAVLVTKLGALPLALDQAGAYIYKRQITFREYLYRFNKTFAELASKKPPDSMWQYREDTVFTTWEMSFIALGPGGQALLNLCAFFDNEDIPEELLPPDILKERFGIGN
ncbi:hypothetical protein K440DRAFT_642105 [Wilcoxina mikolae CBS 423.85]|nr:hypothetical protein K440DRAFT_642105 [Wilcoxina mikolae CBS 423.85]